MNLPEKLKAAPSRPNDFTIPVTDHGFTYVHEDAATIPDDVHLGRLAAIDIALDEITVASQHHLHPAILAEYVAHPPARKHVLLRPYGQDEVAVADGHHANAAARLRGENHHPCPLDQLAGRKHLGHVALQQRFPSLATSG